MCMILGGRVAESLVFKKITTGAHDDLQKCTRLAYAQITTYGMNKSIGQLSWPVKSPTEMKVKPYSDSTQCAIDTEARLLVDKVYERCVKLITEHMSDLEKVAQALLEREVLSHADISEIIGPRPNGGSP